MPVNFVEGDLFADDRLEALAHGCNCAGAMGRGIAVEFKRRYPRMFDEYRDRCRSGLFGLGDVFRWEAADIVVFNLGTQKTWRTKASLAAIEQSLRGMIAIAEKERIRTIGLPRIGAGLGGAPWERVRSLLQELGDATDVELVVFEKFVASQPNLG